MKETRLVVAVDDLDFGIKDLAFEAKVFNKYGTIDQIANMSMVDLDYTYLHYDLLDMVTLTTITLRMKSHHINMHEQHLQKGMFVRVENLALSQNPKGVLRKISCMLSLQLS
jgi:hypothetical protein